MGSRQGCPFSLKSVYFVTASACGTLGKEIVCADARVPSDFKESSDIDFPPTFPTNKKLPMGSMSICKGLVPAAAVGVAMEVRAPFESTEKSETLDDPLLATYKWLVVESKTALIGCDGAVLVPALGTNGEPGIGFGATVFVELEY